MSSNAQLIGAGGGSLRDAFGKALVEVASEMDNLFVLDADVAGGTGVHHFREAFPERFIQGGIAEQNLVGVAAGLTKFGIVPVVATFASFLLRAVDQIRLSVAYSEFNVKIVGSHVGLDAGPDGASAQCIEDLSIFRSIPNLKVVVPASPRQVSAATRVIVGHNGPVYMRTGRSPMSEPINFDDNSFEFGRAYPVREGSDITLAACGPLVVQACKAADALVAHGVRARVLNVSSLDPLDSLEIITAAKETGAIVSIEDHSIVGGLGSAIAELVSEQQPCRVVRMGLIDQAGESGDAVALHQKFRLDSKAIVDVCLRILRRNQDEN